jgi:hypothetical protein
VTKEEGIEPAASVPTPVIPVYEPDICAEAIVPVKFAVGKLPAVVTACPSVERFLDRVICYISL